MWGTRTRGDARRGGAAGHAQHQHPLPARAGRPVRRALAATLPSPLEVCYFTASGSEANELALRLARAHTGARDLVVMDAAYHGHTTTLIDISPYKHAGPGGGGAPDWVHTSPIPDVYRGAHRADDPDAGAKYAREVGAVIDRIRAGGRGLCGYIAETCPSVGGQIVMPAGFLSGGLPPGACGRRRVHRGRSADGLRAHGQPLLGVRRPRRRAGHRRARQAHRQRLSDGRGDHHARHRRAASTTGWSSSAPSAAAPRPAPRGWRRLRATQDEGLQAHALKVGDSPARGAARRSQAAHDIIGDVRGSGLFIGVELVRDRGSPRARHRRGVATWCSACESWACWSAPTARTTTSSRSADRCHLAEHDADCLVGALGRALREL